MAEETKKSESRGNRKQRVGEVVSNKMTKTIVVRVERRFPHPKVQENRHVLQEVLRARRKGRGENRGHGADRGMPSAVQIEALDADSSR